MPARLEAAAATAALLGCLFLATAAEGADPIVGDSSLLDTFESIWMATKIYPEGNVFSIYNRHLEGCLGVQPLTSARIPGVRGVLGTRLTQCNGGGGGRGGEVPPPDSRFFFVPAGAGLVNVCLGYGVGCVNGGLRNGSPALLGRWLDSPSHQFVISSGGDGGFALLVNRGSGACLTAGYSQVKTTPCDPKNPLQQWFICATRTACWPAPADRAPTTVVPAADVFVATVQ